MFTWQQIRRASQSIHRILNVRPFIERNFFYEIKVRNLTLLEIKTLFKSKSQLAELEIRQRRIITLKVILCATTRTCTLTRLQYIYF